MQVYQPKDESPNRYSAVSAKVHMHGSHPWTEDLGQDCYAAYPLYDWTVEDIWTANGKFAFDYNRLYDLYQKAGIPRSTSLLTNERPLLSAITVPEGPMMWTS